MSIDRVGTPCPRCGKPRHLRQLCERCSEIKYRSARKARKRRRDDAICVRCNGKHGVPEVGRSNCQRCIEYQRTATARWRKANGIVAYSSRTSTLLSLRYYPPWDAGRWGDSAERLRAIARLLGHRPAGLAARRVSQLCRLMARRLSCSTTPSQQTNS